jgi:beta-1,4-mannosyltransferase
VRTLILSRWRVNPYQQLLVAELRRLGVEVVERALDPLRVYATVRECRPDVLHLQNIHPFLTGHGRVRSLLNVLAFVVALAMVRLRGVRIVWTVHDLGHHDRSHPLLDHVATALTARLAHARIVHCDAARRELGREATVIPHGHYLGYYPNSVDRPTARRSLGIDDGEFVFLFLGWLRPYKGIAELLDAVTGLPARLLVAGEARDAAFLRSLRVPANAEIHVGAIADDRLQLYLNACDVVVLPYLRILTSGAVILAMSFARPCIAPRLGCMPETLDDAGAFLYESGQLREALIRALEARGELPRMGAHNREKVSEWTWERIAVETAAVYRG